MNNTKKSFIWISIILAISIAAYYLFGLIAFSHPGINKNRLMYLKIDENEYELFEVGGDATSSNGIQAFIDGKLYSTTEVFSLPVTLKEIRIDNSLEVSFIQHLYIGDTAVSISIPLKSN